MNQCREDISVELQERLLQNDVRGTTKRFRDANDTSWDGAVMKGTSPQRTNVGCEQRTGRRTHHHWNIMLKEYEIRYIINYS